MILTVLSGACVTNSVGTLSTPDLLIFLSDCYTSLSSTLVKEIFTSIFLIVWYTCVWGEYSLKTLIDITLIFSILFSAGI